VRSNLITSAREQSPLRNGRLLLPIDLDRVVRTSAAKPIAHGRVARVGAGSDIDDHRLAGNVKLERELIVVIVAAHAALSLGPGTDGEQRFCTPQEAEPTWPRAKPRQPCLRSH